MSARIYHPKYKELFQKRPGGNYYFFSDSSDKSLGTSDIKEALLFLEQAKSHSKLYPGKMAKKKIAELYKLYHRSREKQVEKGKIRPGTLREIEKIWNNHLLKYFGDKTLPWINQRSWSAFCDNSTLKDFQNPRNAMNHFMNWCFECGYTLVIPKLKKPSHERRARKNIPPHHAALLFQFCDNASLTLFLSLLYTTGMRRSEAIKLTWDRVSTEKMMIILRSEDTKTKKARQIPIVSPVDRLFEMKRNDQLTNKVKTNFVFPNAHDPKRHMDPSGFKGSWKRLLERTGLDKEGYSWHDFRSTFEKRTHKASGFTDTERMKIAGSSIEVQRKIYVSMDADDLRPLAEAVQVPEVTKQIESTVKTLSKIKTEKT